MCPTPSRLLLQPITIEDDPQLHQPQQQPIKSTVEAASASASASTSSSASASASSSLDTKSFSSLSSYHSTHLPSLTEWSHSLLSTSPSTTETQTMPAITSSPDPSSILPTTTPTSYNAKSLSPTSQSSMDDCLSPSSPIPKPDPEPTPEPTPAPAPAVTRKRARESLHLPTSVPSSSSSSRSASLPRASSSSTSSVLPLAQPVSPPLSPASSANSRDRFRLKRSSRLTSTELRRRRHRYKDGVRYHSLKAQLDNLREITCEFQTECQHQWDTRTEEWSQEKKQNKTILDRIREQRPDCGRAVLLNSASAMIRHLNNEVAMLRSRIAELEESSSLSIPQCEPTDIDLAAAMEAMIRLAHDQQMLQMGGCMITRYSMDGIIMETNDVSCQYGYTQENIMGTICTSTPHMEEAVPLPPTVDIASTTAKQLMATFLPTSNVVAPWWQHMILVPIGMVVQFISRRRTPQGQYEINVYWRQVEQGIDGVRSIYSVGWDAKVEFLPIPTAKLISSSMSSLPTTSSTTPNISEVS